ncbi:Dabb family protein [Gryllotalpicola ginsengisoli]|uniref:Dabb family protein n=1 Tax=Gryllotalpicola ginsengisoli TaxID=444608 RepID=UPI00040231FA|nr:Dabb family protein [Gryllotalpicola ginsengisoli]
MIRHTVAFRLVHPAGSAEEAAFLDAAAELVAVPGVRDFERLRQIGAKNDFTFGLSMEFDTQAEYEGYFTHPLHEAFVREHWQSEVADFLEIDYTLL